MEMRSKYFRAEMHRELMLSVVIHRDFVLVEMNPNLSSAEMHRELFSTEMHHE